MMVKLRSIGFPLEYLMELYGVDPLDIPRVLGMVKKEADNAMGYGVQQAVNASQNAVQTAPTEDVPAV
jgi:hypothetical protein